MIAELRITLDRDWVALNLFRMTLERIAKEAAEDPWGFSGEDAADMARSILQQFPSDSKA